MSNIRVGYCYFYSREPKIALKTLKYPQKVIQRSFKQDILRNNLSKDSKSIVQWQNLSKSSPISSIIKKQYLILKQICIMLPTNLFFILLPYLSICRSSIYRKITHTTNPQALCLDGSSPALFVHQGNEPQKILIYLQGGGFCQGYDDEQVIKHCYERSKTKYGSSSMWPQQTVGRGLLSTDVHQNKFAEWTKIIMAYCDGSMYQGHRQKPIIYNGTTLHLRGQITMKAQLKYIEENYGLSKANKIIWSGSSAGAVGATYWSKYIYEFVENKDEVYFIIDSGSSSLDVAIDGTNTHLLQVWLRNLHQFTKIESKNYINQQCMKFYSQKPWKCYLNQFNYQFLKGKFLFIDSLYDSWLISNILNKKCLHFQKDSFIARLQCNEQQMTSIQKLRSQHIDLLNKILEKSDKIGVWAISCASHVYINDQKTYHSSKNKVPEHTGLTVKEAIQSFVLQGKRIIAIDDEKYPDNVGCSNFNFHKQNNFQDL